jgi:hypothetical protein
MHWVKIIPHLWRGMHITFFLANISTSLPSIFDIFHTSMPGSTIPGELALDRLIILHHAPPKGYVYSNNLVPFPALFLVFFLFYSTVFYKICLHFIFFAGVVLPALSASFALGFLLNFFRGSGGAGRGIQIWDDVQHSDALLSRSTRC